MEEIIQILIFVGAMVITVVGQNAKNKKKPTAASPQEGMEEAVPDIDIPGMERAPQPPSVKPTLRRTPPKPHTLPEESRKEPEAPVAKQTEKIRLNTRSKARRAFIYAEIFNRKQS